MRGRPTASSNATSPASSAEGPGDVPGSKTAEGPAVGRSPRLPLPGSRRRSRVLGGTFLAGRFWGDWSRMSLPGSCRRPRVLGGASWAGVSFQGRWPFVPDALARIMPQAPPQAPRRRRGAMGGGSLPGLEWVVVRPPGLLGGGSSLRVDAKSAGGGVGASRRTAGAVRRTLRTRRGWAS